MHTKILLGLLASGLVVSAAYAAQIDVSQKDKTFAPEEFAAPVGSTVRVANDDTVVHNILIVPPGGSPKNTGVQKPGESLDFTLDAAGEYQVKCGIHPKMKLTIQAQ